MPKRKLSITMQLDLFDWMEDEIQKGEYANYSHAIEYAMRKLREVKEKPHD